jgi:NAD(P)H-hydrate epimerase
MSGAAVLCATAGLRGGAGLVQVAVPGEILPTVAAGNPCYMTAPFPQDVRGRFAAAAVDELVELAGNWADAVAVGPGLGQSDAAPGLIAALLDRAGKPLVIDADGLNALARLPGDNWRQHPKPVILTPHPGEFARLVSRPAEDVRGQRESLAAEYAARQAVVLVLKGHGTLVTDGRRTYRNDTGNPGMATGGDGRRADWPHRGPGRSGNGPLRRGGPGRLGSWPGRRPGRRASRTNSPDRHRSPRVFARRPSRSRWVARRRRSPQVFVLMKIANCLAR